MTTSPGVGAAAQRWLRRPVPCPRARIRLVCFPHAGGSAGFYRWLAPLDPSVEVLLVQYPGRDTRLRDPWPRSLTALAEEVVAALPSGPLVLFGHSMGAVLAYEVARRVRARALIVSGRPVHPVGRMLHRGSDEEIVDLVRRLGGTHPMVLAEPDLRAMAVTLVRGDLRLLETHTLDAAALTMPVRALTGRDDPAAPVELMSQWADLTTGRFTLTTFPGGHFYFVEQAAAVRAQIQQVLREVDPGDGSARPPGPDRRAPAPGAVPGAD